MNTAAVVIGEDVMINCVVTFTFDINAVIYTRGDGVTGEGVVAGFTDVDAVPVRGDGVTDEGVVASMITDEDAVPVRGDGVTDDGVVAGIKKEDAEPARGDGVTDDDVVAVAAIIH